MGEEPMIETRGERRATYQHVVSWLERRGVTIDEISRLVMEIQSPYIEGLTMDVCHRCVEAVLSKRETQNAVMTGLALDEAAEKGDLPEPLLSRLRTDDGLYGIDEIIALSIVNVYGSIGLTNFGYLDKTKLGVMASLNQPDDGDVNTFLDDLVGAIAAAAAGRMAHRQRDGTLFNGPASG